MIMENGFDMYLVAFKKRHTPSDCPFYTSPFISSSPSSAAPPRSSSSSTSPSSAPPPPLLHPPHHPATSRLPKVAREILAASVCVFAAAAGAAAACSSAHGGRSGVPVPWWWSPSRWVAGSDGGLQGWRAVAAPLLARSGGRPARSGAGCTYGGGEGGGLVVLLVCRWRKDSGAAWVKSPSFLFRLLGLGVGVGTGPAASGGMVKVQRARGGRWDWIVGRAARELPSSQQG
ncbi:uncharacterized protein [Triticum aestivum]|uniref:uncharacterized protein n=1 Tax=Triticum aestivum TaxID=4565 RepID=UPI001D0269C3|nr:uncharacterized protein LOC123067821 [Triticum aestivum]